MDAFACCFCEERDLLSQWRAYGKYEQGYAIEFDWTAVQERFVAELVGRIEYDEATQDGLIRKIIGDAFDPSFLKTDVITLL